MGELEEAWNPLQMLGATPQETAYNVGLRDAFRFLEELRDGTLLEESSG